MAETQLLVSLAPFPPGFKGNPEDWAKATASRLIIKWPFGATQIQIGGLEPTSNIGLWLKDGTKPYVWDDAAKEYIPADISDSIDQPFWYGSTTPTSADPALWFKTHDSGRRGRWYAWDATTEDWKPEAIIPHSGTTANRPALPEELEQYWDTDIDCMIHWERSAWRTVSGTPGDVKFFDSGLTDYAEAVADALTKNPGWSEIDAAFRGRAVGIAGSGAGLTTRAPRDTAGTEEVTLTEAQMPSHTHDELSGLTSANVNGGGPLTNGFMRGDTSTTGVSAWPSSTTNAKGGDEPHDNVPPTVWFVALRKG